MPAKKRMMQDDQNTAPAMPPQMDEPVAAPSPKPKAKAKPKLAKMEPKAEPAKVSTETVSATESSVATKVGVLTIGVVALAAAFGLAYLSIVKNKNQFVRVDRPQINWRAGYGIYSPGYNAGYIPGYQPGYQPGYAPGYVPPAPKGLIRK